MSVLLLEWGKDDFDSSLDISLKDLGNIIYLVNLL